MGLFDATTDKTKSTSSIPAWLEEAGKINYGLASQIASRPRPTYPFARIAGFTGDQNSAMQMLRDYKPNVDKMSQPLKLPRLIDNIPGEGKAGTIQDYMDPFVDTVLNRTQDRVRTAMDSAKQWQSNVASHQAGAFGDARHGVADSLIEAEGIKTMKDAAAEGYSQAFNTAMGLRDADINRLLSTAEFDRAGLDNILTYIDSLYRSGGNQQALDQQNMQLMYKDFQDQFNYPIDMLNLLFTAAGQTPHSTTTTTEQPGPSTASSIVSTIGSLLSAFL